MCRYAKQQANFKPLDFLWACRRCVLGNYAAPRNSFASWSVSNSFWRSHSPTGPGCSCAKEAAPCLGFALHRRPRGGLCPTHGLTPRPLGQTVTAGSPKCSLAQGQPFTCCGFLSLVNRVNIEIRFQKLSCARQRLFRLDGQVQQELLGPLFWFAEAYRTGSCPSIPLGIAMGPVA